MKLKEIIDDIFDDMRTADQRHEDSMRDMGVFMPKYRARRDNYGLWSTLFPHIIGFIAGLAISKLFGMSGAAYVVFGTICAFAAGTYKSIAMDKISFLPALIRNLLITGAVVIISTIVVLTDKE